MHFPYKSALIIAANLSAIVANLPISKVSPRMRASKPDSDTARSACSLETPGICELIALTSVFLRWLNAALITLNKNCSFDVSAGWAVRLRSLITEEVTFGWGMKQEGGTSNKSSVSMCHCTKMPNAP